MPQDFGSLGLNVEDVRKAFAKKAKKTKVSAYDAAGPAPKIKSNMLAEAGDEALAKITAAKQKRAQSLAPDDKGRLSQEATDRIAKLFLVPEAREDTETMRLQKDTSRAQGYMAAYDKARFGKLTFGDPEYNDQDRKMFAEAVRTEWGMEGPSADWLHERLGRVHAEAKRRGETKLGSIDEALALPFGPTSLSQSTDEARASRNADWIEKQKARIAAETKLGGYDDQPDKLVTPISVAHDMGQGLYDASKWASGTLATFVDQTIMEKDSDLTMAEAAKQFDQSTLGQTAKASSEALPYFIPILGQAAMIEGLVRGELAFMESGNPVDFLTHSGMDPVANAMLIMDKNAPLSTKISGAFGLVLMALGAKHGVQAIKKFRAGDPNALASGLQGVKERFGPEVFDETVALFDREKFTRALVEEGKVLPPEYDAQEPLKIVETMERGGKRKAAVESDDAEIGRILDRARWLREEAGRRFGSGLRGNRQSADPSEPVKTQEPDVALEADPAKAQEPPPLPPTAQSTRPAQEPAPLMDMTGVDTIWYSPDGDVPVRVTAYLGRGQDGRHYLKIEGSDTGIPMDEVFRTPEQIAKANLEAARPTGPDEPLKVTPEPENLPKEAPVAAETPLDTSLTPEAPVRAVETPKTTVPEAELTPAAKAKRELADLWAEIKQDLGTGPEVIGSFPTLSPAQLRAVARFPELVAKAAEAGFKTSKEWADHVVEQLGEWARPHAEKAWDDSHPAQKDTPAAKVAEAVEPPVGEPRSDTGLSNYVQEQEAVAGIIRKIEPTSGRTAEEFLAMGEDAVARGFDYLDLAEDVAAGKAEMTGQHVGILTAGKRRLLDKIEQAKSDLDRDPGNAAKSYTLDRFRDELDIYLRQIQLGKGRWSDTGRALQINLDLDFGDIEQVMAEAKRKSKDGRIHKSDVKRIRTAVDNVKTSRAKEADAVTRLKEEAAKETVKSAVVRKKGRVFNKAAVTADMADAIRQWKELKSTNVRPSKQAGARAKITSKDVATSVERAKLIKRIAVNWLKLNTVIKLEDAVTGVQGFFRSALNTDIERQAVIDALAMPEGKRTVSDIQRNITDIRNSAKRNSTDRLIEDRLRDQRKYIEAEDKRIRREYQGAERKKALSALNAERQAVEEAWNEVQAARRAEWQDVKDKQRAYDRIKRAEELSQRQEYIDWWNAQEKQRRYNERTDKRQTIEEYEAERRIEEQMLRDDQAQYDKDQSAKTAKENKEYRDWWNAQASILDLKQKLANKDFVVPTKKQVETAQEIIDLRAQRRVWENRVRANIEAQKVPIAQRWAHGIPQFVRQFFLGSDIGVVARQGLFGVARPKALLRSLKIGAEAAMSEREYQKWDDLMMNKRSARDGSLMLSHRKAAGLSTSDLLGHPEEIAALRVMRHAGLKIAEGAKPGSFRDRVGNLPGVLERFQSAYINSLRIETFDAAYDAGYTPAELQLRAKFINNATGRGNYKDTPGELAQIFLTSPRYEKSRWAMLAEPARAGVFLAKDLATLRRVNRAAYANIQDMVVTAGLTLGLFKLSEGAGYHVDYDPQSSDFLKMRKGDEVWDVSAGIAPRLRDVMRLYVLTEFGRPDYNKNAARMLGSTVSRALSPVIKGPVVQYSAQKQLEADPGQKPTDWFTGFELEDKDIGFRAYLPLIVQAIIDTNEKEGAWAAASAGAREFIGQSVNRYPERKPKDEAGSPKKPTKPKTLKERRDAQIKAYRDRYAKKATSTSK